jgi:uncharacterized protein YbjT (DUF2867 family)
MILVIGGRSKIGAAVIRELIERGENVRALVRSSEPAAFPDHVETVRGDLADVGSLTAAMSGVEKVFLLCGPAQDEYRLNHNAIEAAESGEVRLLVRSSILGSDPDSPATFITETVQGLTGRPARTLRDLLSEQPAPAPG